MENAVTTVLLIARSKFGVTGLMTFAKLDDFDIVVTDERPDAEALTQLKNSKAQLIVADER